MYYAMLHNVAHQRCASSEFRLLTLGLVIILRITGCLTQKRYGNLIHWPSYSQASWRYTTGNITGGVGLINYVLIHNVAQKRLACLELKPLNSGAVLNLLIIGRLSEKYYRKLIRRPSSSQASSRCTTGKIAGGVGLMYYAMLHNVAHQRWVCSEFRPLTLRLVITLWIIGCFTQKRYGNLIHWPSSSQASSTYTTGSITGGVGLMNYLMLHNVAQKRLAGLELKPLNSVAVLNLLIIGILSEKYYRKLIRRPSSSQASLRCTTGNITGGVGLMNYVLLHNVAQKRLASLELKPLNSGAVLDLLIVGGVSEKYYSKLIIGLSFPQS